MSTSRLPQALLLAATAALLGARASAQTVIPLNPKATFLHTSSDPVPSSTPVSLAPLGITAGKCVRIRPVGDFDFGPAGDTGIGCIGVFSASPTILAASLLHRVPDAIDAGTDYVSVSTFFGNQPTDIAEDFTIALDGGQPETTVEVPAGAAWLFLSTADHYFSDNIDPDADWGVDLTLVGCWKDLGLGLAGVNGTPVLSGAGTLLGGDPLTLALGNGKPFSSAALVLGFSQLNAPFKGGTLVPAADLLIPGLPLDAAGALALPATWPAGLPSDFTLYLQAWITDAAGPHGFSASNGLSATTP